MSFYCLAVGACGGAGVALLIVAGLARDSGSKKEESDDGDDTTGDVYETE